MQIDRLYGIEFQQPGDRGLILRSAVVPKRIAQVSPSSRESDLVSIRVLDDEPLQRLRLFSHNPETNRTAVVLHVQAESVKALLLQKMLNNLRQLVVSASANRV